MQTQEIDRQNWNHLFDLVNKQSLSSQVYVESLGIDIGDQIEEDWTRIKGIYFDPEMDRCCVSTEKVDHFIRSPKRVQMIAEGTRVSAIQIEGHAGQKQIIRLRQPILVGDKNVI